MSIPSIAAVLLFYNDRRIFELLNSALNQNYPFTELIIVDDGSDYQLFSEVRNYCADISNLKLIKLEKNRGIPEAMRTGINASNCKYFYLMSCGDIYQNNILENYILINWSLGFPGVISSGILTFNQKNSLVKKYFQKNRKKGIYSNSEYGKLLRQTPNIFYGGGCIVNKDAADKTLKYFDKLGWAADLFMYYYAAFTNGAMFCDNIFMTCLIHENRYSSTENNENTLNVVKEFILCCERIDKKFYKFASNSGLLPSYSIKLGCNLLKDRNTRKYMKPFILYRCLVHGVCSHLKYIVPHRFKIEIRKYFKV